MALEQKYLNVTTRRDGYMDIIMYVPDDNIVISNVSCDDVLLYSDLLILFIKLSPNVYH